MPEIDGWTFFEDVRKRPETAWVPFVFLTVERELPQRLRGLHLGADDYMTKPFAVEELEARIERLLERSVDAKRARADGSGGLLAGSVEHLAITGPAPDPRAQREGRHRGARAAGPGAYRIRGWPDRRRRGGVGSRDEGVVPHARMGRRDVSRDAEEGEISDATIASPTSTVLMDGLVSLDEWSRWAGLLPGGRPESSWPTTPGAGCTGTRSGLSSSIFSPDRKAASPSLRPSRTFRTPMQLSPRRSAPYSRAASCARFPSGMRPRRPWSVRTTSLRL